MGASGQGTGQEPLGMERRALVRSLWTAATGQGHGQEPLGMERRALVRSLQSSPWAGQWSGAPCPAARQTLPPSPAAPSPGMPQELLSTSSSPSCASQGAQGLLLLPQPGRVPICGRCPSPWQGVEMR